MRFLKMGLILAILVNVTVLFGEVRAAESAKLNFTPAPIHVVQNELALKKLIASHRVAEAGCGLCSDTDCCGGASLGWKLCQNGCPSGEKKCMLVANCP